MIFPTRAAVWLSKRWLGHQVEPPPALLIALAQVFEQPIAHVRIFECSPYARWHAGARATTRRNLILVSGPAKEFWADLELVLHEYFHVLRQWQPRRLTILRYTVESLQRGYWLNRYEIEARDFAAAHLGHLRSLLSEPLPNGTFPFPAAHC